jgi:hypothetical protein
MNNGKLILKPFVRVALLEPIAWQVDFMEYLILLLHGILI